MRSSRSPRTPALGAALALAAACVAPEEASEAGGARFSKEDVLAAEVGPAPHAWVDAVHGFRVESDFPEAFFAPLLELWVHPRVTVHREVFGIEDLSGLTVRVHDRPPVTRDEFLVNGFHVGSEVHVFAGSDGGALARRAEDRRGLDTLTHELLHALIAEAGLRVDRWLEEGLCQVFSDVRLDSAGTPWVWPDPDNEMLARRLVLDGVAFEPAELVAHEGAYPAAERLSVFYVQAQSFTDFLFRERAGPLRARLDAVLALDAAELALAGERWREEIRRLDLAALYADVAASGDATLERAVLEELGRFARTGAWWDVVASLAASRTGPDLVLDVVELLRAEPVGPDWWRVFDALAARHEPAVRRRAGEVLLGAGQDASWWGAVRRLLEDADAEVRRTARHVAVLAPEDRPETWAELAALQLVDAAELRRTSSLALARLGEASAGVAFLTDLAEEPEPGGWVFDLAQLQLAFPDYPDHPDLADVAAGVVDLFAYAAHFGAWLDANAGRLNWRPHARRYSLRPGE